MKRGTKELRLITLQGYWACRWYDGGLEQIKSVRYTDTVDKEAGWTWKPGRPQPPLVGGLTLQGFA